MPDFNQQLVSTSIRTQRNTVSQQDEVDAILCRMCIDCPDVSIRYAVHEAPLFGGLTCEVALQGQSALGILATGHLHCGAFSARQHCHLQMLFANHIMQQHK